MSASMRGLPSTRRMTLIAAALAAVQFETRTKLHSVACARTQRLRSVSELHWPTRPLAHCLRDQAGLDKCQC